jgi:glyoxylase-like metal-dependent hydrolase (beta-lactamase superfamily II)
MTAHHFSVGAIECVALHDGDVDFYEASQYVANGAVGDAERAIALHGHDPKAIRSPYSGLLVRSGDHTVLIDTGAGPLTPTVGKLLQNMRHEGIDPSEIDVVVITHGHPDHIGGNVDDEGRPIFPNARYVMSKDEWSQWTDEAFLARQAPVFATWAHRNLDPLRDRMSLLEGPTEIAPGVEAIDASGHTAGHLAIALHSDGEQLMYISDAALHPIHLEHPEWHPIWDLDPTAAVATKRELLDRAAADDALVLAFHFPPFPSLGRVTRAGSAWRWSPVTK